MQILFVDESGSPPKAPGKQNFFVLGGVVIPEDHWRPISDELGNLKRKFGIAGEIKWRFFSPHNSDDDNSLRHLEQEDRNKLRKEIYDLITSRKSVKLIACVASVTECFKLEYIQDDDSLYHFTYKPITERFQYYLQDLSRTIGRTENGIIICDHRGPKDDKRLRELHQRLLTGAADNFSKYDNLIEGLLIAPSHFSVGIQLADMVAGAIWRRVERNDHFWFDQIRGSFRQSSAGKINGYGIVKLPKTGWDIPEKLTPGKGD